MKKYKITVVNYSNTLPFLWGMEQSAFIRQHCDIIQHYPAACFEALHKKTVDIGIVPVAPAKHYILRQKWHFVTDYCIASRGKVNSVLLLSEKPLPEIRQIFLDYQSRTSVDLLKIIIRKFYRLSHIQFIPSYPGYETSIEKRTAGLIIGDRALALKSHFPFVYDLSEEWMKHVGLPFVFAAWATHTSLPEDLTKELNLAFFQGIQSIPDMIKKHHLHSLKNYLLHDIHYTWDEEKRKAVEYFWKMLR